MTQKNLKIILSLLILGNCGPINMTQSLLGLPKKKVKNVISKWVKCPANECQSYHKCPDRRPHKECPKCKMWFLASSEKSHKCPKSKTPKPTAVGAATVAHKPTQPKPLKGVTRCKSCGELIGPGKPHVCSKK